jgi:hypothetical protein
MASTLGSDNQSVSLPAEILLPPIGVRSKPDLCAGCTEFL